MKKDYLFEYVSSVFLAGLATFAIAYLGLHPAGFQLELNPALCQYIEKLPVYTQGVADLPNLGSMEVVNDGNTVSFIQSSDASQPDPNGKKTVNRTFPLTSKPAFIRITLVPLDNFQNIIAKFQASTSY